MIKKSLIYLTLLFASLVNAQKTPFFDEIQAFKKQDSLQKPPEKMLLFIGSSSFTRWKTLKEDFNNDKIVNRAFGGSTLLDVLHYQNDVIFKYQPQKIFIYCGENDIANAAQTSAKEVCERFKLLHQNIRAKFPNIPIYYISMKPSVLRWSMKDRIMEGNKLIKRYINKKKNTYFINIWDKMLNEAGTPKTELFVEDQLHMNKKGYAIWITALKEYLGN